MKIGYISDHIEILHELSADDAAQARSAMENLRLFYTTIQAHTIAHRNFEEFNQTIERFEKEFSESKLAIRLSVHADRAMIEVNRLLINFLSSVRTYFDTTSSRLSGPLQEQFSSWRSTQYDKSPSYRLMENIRNVAQHKNLPIKRFKAERTRLSDGSYTASHEFFFSRSSILESRKLQPRVRTEVSEWNADHEIRSEVSAYFQCIGYIQLQLLREEIPAYVPDANFLTSLLKEIKGEVAPYFFEYGSLKQEDMNFQIIDPDRHLIMLVTEYQRIISLTDFNAL